MAWIPLRLCVFAPLRETSSLFVSFVFFMDCPRNISANSAISAFQILARIPRRLSRIWCFACCAPRRRRTTEI